MPQGHDIIGLRNLTSISAIMPIIMRMLLFDIIDKYITLQYIDTIRFLV
jgi:hypothetical protein